MPHIELGQATLYVRDLARSRAFYVGVLGFSERVALAAGGRPVGVALTGGGSHHELVLLEVGADAQPVGSGLRVGLAHLGLRVGDDDAALRAVHDRLVAADVEVLGAIDRGITHALAVADPDGNELELYVEVVDPEHWRRRPDLLVHPPRPLAW